MHDTLQWHLMHVPIFLQKNKRSSSLEYRIIFNEMKHMNQPTFFCHPMDSLGKDVILNLKRTKKTQQTTKQKKGGIY